MIPTNPSRYKRSALILLICFSAVLRLAAQKNKVWTQPYADQKLYHFGFSLGLNAQDLVLKQTGVTGPGGTWYGDIPGYSPGFTVGLIADRYINQYLNLRVLPSLYFGEKRYVFREQATNATYATTIRNNYLSLPVLLKFSANRLNNYRPYVLGGTFLSTELGGAKGQAVRLNRFDYGIELGIGCNFYLPLFKFCPELRFSFGLRDLVDKQRSDLTDKDLMKYTDALASGRSRMISLILNFE